MRLIKTSEYNNGWKVLIWIGNTVCIVSGIPLLLGYYKYSFEDQLSAFLIGLGLLVFGKVMNKRTALKDNDFNKSNR